MLVRDKCPICGGSIEEVFSCSFSEPALARVLAHVPTIKAGIAGQTFAIDYCAACNFYYQRLVPSLSELADIYGAHSDSSDIRRDIATQKLHWFSHMAEEILVMRQMVKHSQPKVLDYGSNWGKWASMALAFGCDVYAVEVNPVAAEFCASRGIKILNRDELHAHVFDFINVDQVMEHVSDPLELALLLARCLAPQGMMKWSTPGNTVLPDGLRRAQMTRNLSVLAPETLDALEPFVHINLFTNQSLRKLAAAAGLRIVKQSFVQWLGAGQLWNMPRQIGRNLSVPKKRWLGQGTYLWFSHVHE